ncbi:metal ABC transporter substrate-binding protein [Lactobacillus sp. PV037]|uniref:metal ABC transporter solute-binding protein, Zn/Mn family n=1 Tax=unclassified Lactobacillus TaxID=2620435 RepID=UPI00223F4DEB|nr:MULTISPECIES: zinc ABC transporter substrate-binding protein [unclassified Lactobacillus]QNQ82407.1 metal ABC transporter substrate-binding protein [Lactobacillus sp. PV012]QNQ83480.1 metal ABC transporter substrate-binding protein [Lactobacillus sp. PV037]
MKKKKLLSIFLMLGIFLLILTGCGKQSTTSSKKINIVTSTNIYANIAQNIVGKYGNATAIIKSGAIDPHDFEPTTNDAKSIQNAQLVISNGLGYDDWMDKLANANNKRITKVGNDILKLPANANPHIWYDLEMPTKYTQYLVKQLSKLDKKHASYYQSQGKKYLKRISEVKAIANHIDGKHSKPVYVSEPVFDYALKATGFTIGDKAFEEAIEKETDPTPQVINEMTTNINHQKIAFFVNNTQVNSSTVDTFVKKAKAHQIPILSVRETMPTGDNYLSWIKQNYQNLAKVAKKK